MPRIPTESHPLIHFSFLYMKILFIAPLPPPFHGQSYVSQVLLDDIRKHHTVRIVNTTKKNSVAGRVQVGRTFEVLGILSRIWKVRKGNDAVYLTISESMSGNIKDLLSYCCFAGSLSRIVIHLHGGSIKKEHWDRRPFFLKLNRYFIRRFGSVIISGRSHAEIFEGMISPEKVQIIPNFAPDDLFIEEAVLAEKFTKTDPLKILYISGLREKKGYLDLLDAFFLLSDEQRQRVRIDFAGAFETEDGGGEFLERIRGHEEIRYMGIVEEEVKRELYFSSHVFCLPTKYFEGQPISILEAYAAGCFVITTPMGGIPDIFSDPENGLYFQPGSPESLASVISRCLEKREELAEVAKANRKLAKERYKKEEFTGSVIRILESIKSYTT